jgi:periplasmic protein TonB
MSVTGALSTGSLLATPPRAAVRPQWLRPLALVAILALHGLVFLTLKGKPAALSPLDAVEVMLAPLGDSAEDQKRQDEIKPAELAAPEPPPPPPQAEKVEPVEAPPPVVAAPEAVPLPVEPPKPAPPPPQKTVVEKKPPPRPVETRQDRLREERKDREIAESRRKAQEARQELKRGATDGAARATSMSPAAYAGLLAAEIRRHTFYPASARAAGITGAVGVAFTIGPSGRVISQSITRSSGNPVLDAAARTTLSSVHTPPPPGGRFSTSTNIRFHFD